MKVSVGSRFGFAVAGLAAAMLFVVFAQGAGAQVEWTCNGVPATLVGTPGPDILEGTPGVDVIVAREGNDVITALGGDDIVCAGKGRDQIFGGGGFDIIYAGRGNDTIYAANGSSKALRDDTGARMFGGAGDDTIHGSTQRDRMDGGRGADKLLGYEARDTLLGGRGQDRLNGGKNIDDLRGGKGSDLIVMTNRDKVTGGPGFDRCNIKAGTAATLLSCGLNEIEREAPAEPVPSTPAEPVPSTPAEPVPSTPAEPVPSASAQVTVISCNAGAETVQIQNAGDQPITLVGWKLHDEDSNFEFELDEVTVGAKQTMIMLSGIGTADIAGATRWSDRNVWNNDGDVATLVRPDRTTSMVDC